MPDARRVFGTTVENEIAEHLARQGYRVLARQYKTPFGEVDLICQDGDEVVFVEVKARTSGAYGYPEQSVHPGKLRKIVRSAQAFMQKRPPDEPWRVDVVAVETAPAVRITHLKAVDTPEGFW